MRIRTPFKYCFSIICFSLIILAGCNSDKKVTSNDESLTDSKKKTQAENQKNSAGPIVSNSSIEGTLEFLDQQEDDKSRIGNNDLYIESAEPVDDVRNKKNNITGKWQITKISTPRAEPEIKLFKKLFEKGHLFSIEVKEDPEGINSPRFTFSMQIKGSQPNCTFQMNYDVAYCCEIMRKITLEKVGNPTESSPQCIENNLKVRLDRFSTWMESALLIIGSPSEIDDFPQLRFTFHKNHLNLKGSFINAYSQPDPGTLTEMILKEAL